MERERTGAAARHPVFVDDTGTKRQKTRVLMRTLVGLVLAFLLLVAVGLGRSPSVPSWRLQGGAAPAEVDVSVPGR